MKTLVCTLMAILTVQSATGATVRVLTDRTEGHLKPLFDLFEQNTGIEVEAVYADKGMMARLETNPKEADLVITKTAENLEEARKMDLLRPINDKIVDHIDEAFVDEDNYFVITSYRPRVIYFSDARVNPENLSTYADLTNPRWQGKIAIRSGYHAYNMSLFCQMVEDQGLEATEAFIKGLKANLARTPTGNDRAQVQAIYEGKADLSVGNSYYMGIMMSREDQRPWAEATEIFFPNQQQNGAYVMRSAAGLTKANRNRKEANQLLDYMLGDFGQYYLATVLGVYSVTEGVPISEFNKTLGRHQENVKNGKFKANFVSLRNIGQHREAVIEILNRINFDE